MKRSTASRRKADASRRELNDITPALVERAGGECEARIEDVCLNLCWNPADGEMLDWRFSRHHRLPRSHGGGNQIGNLALLCGSGTTGCHGFIESHKTWAYEAGWLIPSYREVK